MNRFELKDNQEGFSLLEQLLGDTSRTLPQDMMNALMRFVVRLRVDDLGGNRPVRVCLCGSTRFTEAYQQANLTETLAGRIVLTIGCDLKSDHHLFADCNEAELERIKKDLDELHLRKIDLADEILVLNVGGYIGASTLREIEYAAKQGKSIRYWEPNKYDRSYHH